MTSTLYRALQKPAADAPPSVVHYVEFQRAYEFFNDELFDGALPDCLIVMTRKPKTHGYLAPYRWASEATGDVLHELGAESPGLRRAHHRGGPVNAGP